MQGFAGTFWHFGGDATVRESEGSRLRSLAFYLMSKRDFSYTLNQYSAFCCSGEYSSSCIQTAATDFMSWKILFGEYVHGDTTAFRGAQRQMTD